MVSPAPKSSKFPVRLLSLVFSIGAMLGSGIWYGFNRNSATSSQAQSNLYSESQPTTRAEYERLKMEMPVAEVESILDPGIEVSRTKTTATFVWENPNGSKLTVIFENGKLKTKEQSGLR